MTERDQDDDSGAGGTGARRIDVEGPDDTGEDEGDDAADTDADGPGDAVTTDTGPDAELWNQRLDSLKEELANAETDAERAQYREQIDDLRSKMREAGLLTEGAAEAAASTAEPASDAETDAPDAETDAPDDRGAATTDAQESAATAAATESGTEPPSDGRSAPDDASSDEADGPPDSDTADPESDAESTADAEAEPPSADAEVSPTDEGSSTAAEAGDADSTTAELSALRDTVSDLDERLDDLERLFTEYKRKNERQHEILQKDAVEGLANRMLRVRETLLRAIEYNDWDDAEADQLRGIVKQFDQQLTAKEIDSIDPEPGDEIDDLRHELAAPRKESEDVGPDRVLRVERRGFEVSGYPIRPAEIVATKRD